MTFITGIFLIILLLIKLIKFLTAPTYPEPNETRHRPSNPRNEKKEIGTPFYTNAPEHWGVVTDEFLKSNKNFAERYDEESTGKVLDRRQWMVNSLVLMGTINETFKKTFNTTVNSGYSDALLECTDRYATTCCVEKLFDKGTISVTGIAIDDYERFGVMLFDKPVSIKYVNQLRDMFIEDGYVDLIYYAVNDPHAMTDNLPVKFENFNKQCFQFNVDKQGKNNRKYNNYAIWWASSAEPNFSFSIVKDELRVCLDLLDFHNSYALGVLSFAFGLKQDNNRTKLPDYDEVIITGPEGVEIIISLSIYQGINFHFPMLPRFERYRNNFFKVYLNFCYDIRAQVVELDLPQDDFENLSALEWYDQVLEESDNGNKLTSLGVLTNNYN